MEFTAAVARSATGQSARIYPLSARTALAAGGDRGFEEFRSADAERGDSDLAHRECALRGVLARLGNGDNTRQAGQTSAGEGR